MLVRQDPAKGYRLESKAAASVPDNSPVSWSGCRGSGTRSASVVGRMLWVLSLRRVVMLSQCGVPWSARACSTRTCISTSGMLILGHKSFPGHSIMQQLAFYKVTEKTFAEIYVAPCWALEAGYLPSTKGKLRLLEQVGD